MTDKEIIKALECCIKQTSDCENCPYYKKEECFDMAKRDALNLINRQQAELDDLKRDTIPKLQEGLKRANKYGLETDEENKKLQAEIERLNNELHSKVEYIHEQLEIIKNKKAEIERLKEDNEYLNDCVDTVYNLVKEMVGEQK